MRQSIPSPKQLRNIGIYATISFVIVIAIKGIIRPLHLELNPVETILLGVSPNFFAATGFCAIFYIYFIYFFKRSIYGYLNTKGILTSFALSFLGLSIWEYIQFYFWQYPIDYLDILATIVGSFFTALVLIMILIKKLKNRKQ